MAFTIANMVTKLAFRGNNVLKFVYQIIFFCIFFSYKNFYGTLVWVMWYDGGESASALFRWLLHYLELLKKITNIIIVSITVTMIPNFYALKMCFRRIFLILRTHFFILHTCNVFSSNSFLFCKQYHKSRFCDLYARL